MVGRRSFPFGMVYFQGIMLSFRWVFCGYPCVNCWLNPQIWVSGYMLGLRPNLWKDHPAVVFLFSTLEAEQNPYWWILIDARLVENRKDWRDDIAVVLSTMVHRCISAWISCFTLHKKAQQLHTPKRSILHILIIYVVIFLKVYMFGSIFVEPSPIRLLAFLAPLQLATKTAMLAEVYLLLAMFWCYRHCYGAPGDLGGDFAGLKGCFNTPNRNTPRKNLLPTGYDSGFLS